MLFGIVFAIYEQGYTLPTLRQCLLNDPLPVFSVFLSHG